MAIHRILNSTDSDQSELVLSVAAGAFKLMGVLRYLGNKSGAQEGAQTKFEHVCIALTLRCAIIPLGHSTNTFFL